MHKIFCIFACCKAYEAGVKRSYRSAGSEEVKSNAFTSSKVIKEVKPNSLTSG